MTNRKNDSRGVGKITRDLMAIEPWFVLAMASQLTPEQWQVLVTQQAMSYLHG